LIDQQGNQQRPTVNLVISGIKVTALVDTGATCSLLRRDVFDLVVHKTHRSNVLHKSLPLRGLGGLSLQVDGQTQIKVAGVRNPLNVVICRNIPHEMILGNDALRSGNGVIDLKSNILSWSHNTWPLRKHKSTGYASVGPIFPETGSAAIDNLIHKNSDVFSAKGEKNGCCTTGKLRIKTSGPPICQKAYRLPLTKRATVDKLITEMLADDVIQPSNSPFASPILLVPKKDGETRFCVDYRKLNAVTEASAFPIPSITDIFDLCGNSAIYSTLDLKAGYHQMRVAEEDIHKTAFRCFKGQFEFKKVPFVLKTAPNFFQQEMNFILSDLIGVCVFVYIDDILVFSKNEEDHLHHLQLVFDRLRKVGLKLKPTKCSFGLPEVKLLGYVLNSEGIQADPDKVAAIADLPTPTTIKEVRSLLGMTNYYRTSLPNYATIAEPLIQLTRKYTKFTWTSEHQSAFDELKSLLISSHVMAAPDLNRGYKLFTDASDYAVGGILVQDSSDGSEKVIQYISHTLSKTQRKWATIEKEAYALVYCLEKLRPYLFGASVNAYVDHKPLLSLFTKSMNNTKVQRWAVLLAEYGVKIHYISGKRNIRADILSRINSSKPVPVDVIDTGEDFDPQSIQEDNLIETLPWIHANLNLQEIGQAQRSEFPDLWTRANSEEDDDYQIINGVLYSLVPPRIRAPLYPRLVLPKAFRAAVIDRTHTELGHVALWKCVERLTEVYVWKGLRKDVLQHLNKCAICLVNNPKHQRFPMGEMPIANSPIELIGIDIVGPFVTSANGNKYLLTIIDHYTGWIEAYPLPDQSNKSVWYAFSTQFIPRFGVPHVLLSDNAGSFTAAAFETYLKQMGITHKTITPNHPQSAGKIERCHLFLKSILTKAVNNVPSSWEDVLGDALLACRATVSTTTSFTPHFLMTGRRIRLPLQKALQSHGPNEFGNRLDTLSNVLKIARQMTIQSREYNRKRLQEKANNKLISPGDHVVVKAEERLTFTSRWDPMFIVTRVNGPVVYLRHQQTGKTKILNQEKVRLVNPEQIWTDLNSRPHRKRQGRVHQQTHGQRDVIIADNDGQLFHAPPTRPVSQGRRNHAHKRRRHSTGQSRDEGDTEATPHTTQTETETNDRQVDKHDEQTGSADSNCRRSCRRRRLSRRAQEATHDQSHSDNEVEIDPIISHYRKRKTQPPDDSEQKRARWDHVNYVYCYMRA